MNIGPGLVLLLALLAIAAYVIIAYNGLVRARQIMREAWSGIDVQLKGFVATADLKRKGGRSEANYAARIANCSARDGFGLKAYLACRLRIM